MAIQKGKAPVGKTAPAKAPVGKTAPVKEAVKETAKAPVKEAVKAPVEKAPAKGTAKAPVKETAKAPVEKAPVKETAKAPAKGKKSKGDFKPTTYTKQDVIAEMASTHGYTKAEAEKHLDNTITSIETIVGKLNHGITENGKFKSDKLIFMGFIGIEIAERQAKKGWDNFNHVAIEIPAKLAMKLTVGSSLKSMAKDK